MCVLLEEEFEYPQFRLFMYCVFEAIKFCSDLYYLHPLVPVLLLIAVLYRYMRVLPFELIKHIQLKYACTVFMLALNIKLFGWSLYLIMELWDS